MNTPKEKSKWSATNLFNSLTRRKSKSERQLSSSQSHDIAKSLEEPPMTDYRSNDSAYGFEVATKSNTLPSQPAPLESAVSMTDVPFKSYIDTSKGSRQLSAQDQILMDVARRASIKRTPETGKANGPLGGTQRHSMPALHSAHQQPQPQEACGRQAGGTLPRATQPHSVSPQGRYPPRPFNVADEDKTRRSRPGAHPQPRQSHSLPRGMHASQPLCDTPPASHQPDHLQYESRPEWWGDLEEGGITHQHHHPTQIYPTSLSPAFVHQSTLAFLHTLSTTLPLNI